MTSIIALPDKRQIEWQDSELGVFCHFGTNTFTGLEWGDGKASPEVFNPTSLDCEQWVLAAKNAGFKYFVLTCKHHDGFCLWPTRTTEYSVKSSPWKDGKGDVVRECAEACKKHGIRFGTYLSPWDRHEPCYVDKVKYDEFYIAQLTELMTEYGDIFEVWFDGAGSQGRVYDWEGIIQTVERYQPNAVVFNMGKPSIRWVCNEDGLAPEECWNSLDKIKERYDIGDMKTWAPDTPPWLPSECDVSILRPKWFYMKEHDDLLLSSEQLMELYYKSVGRGANLLLNLPPDKNGLIPQNQIDSLIGFSKIVKEKFSIPIKEISENGYETILELDEETTFSHIQIMEDIAFGERIQKYSIFIKENEKWVNLIDGTAIGHKRIIKLNNIKTNSIKLVVKEALDIPKIKQLAVYK